MNTHDIYFLPTLLNRMAERLTSLAAHTNEQARRLAHKSKTIRGRVHAVVRPRASQRERRQLANKQVQLAYLQTGLAIVLPSQLESGEPILIGSEAAVDRLVQIDQAALDYEKD